jgi:transposase
MFHYKQIIERLRAGETEREISRSRFMGRQKVAKIRVLAKALGWLDTTLPLPDDELIAAQFSKSKATSHTALPSLPGITAPVVTNTASTNSSHYSSVDPWRHLVALWISQGINGAAIHAALTRDHGYKGSYSSVYRMMLTLRGNEQPDVTVRLHFDPAEAAQVDFGAGPHLIDPNGQKRRTWAFVMTLAFSRHQYVEFVWDQTVATWLGCHRRAFEWFGGVPKRVIIDNPKCAITKACTTDPVVQRSYAECAQGYGFKIDPCPPRDPQKKGIVEAGVKYVKNNFLALRTFRDLSDLNHQAKTWVMQQAGLRIHGTTRKAPLALFEFEHSVLTPLPTIAPDLGAWQMASVHRDCHIQFDHRLYSVPFTLVGKRLWLRATDCAIAIYDDLRHIVTHPRGLKLGQRITVNDHLPPHSALFFAHDRQWCDSQATQIGSACQQLIRALLGDQILERLRAAQGVLRLSDQYGAVRLEAACARALAHDSPHYRTVKSILKGGHDLRVQEFLTKGPSPLSDHDKDADDTNTGYGQKARFVRDAQSLFTPKPHGLIH